MTQKPADLPVQQPTTFEFVINLKTGPLIFNRDVLTLDKTLFAQAPAKRSDKMRRSVRPVSRDGDGVRSSPGDRPSSSAASDPADAIQIRG